MKFPYEEVAYRGDPMPEGLCVVDQFTFLSLRHLYAQVRNGSITYQQAALEKGKLAYQNDLELRTAKSAQDLHDFQFILRKNTEAASVRYRKNRTLENADLLVDVIDGLARKVD